ncbi:MAG: lamin tail domain-containing protein [Candidatus Moranbacteria bacterium]|nr:lamin tail domain-containing protein [Candidatus Moranbacteria bacterium]
MKTKIIFISVSVFLYVFFDIPTVSADVIISEFSIGKYVGGKATSTNGDDFIELYNTGSRCVPLEHWKLRKRIQSGTESSLREIEKGQAIMPSDFFLWVSSAAKSEYQTLADTTSSATLTGNGSIALFDSSGSIKDSVIFGGGHTNPFSSSITLLNPGDGLSNERNLSSLEWKVTSVTPNPTGVTSIVSDDLDGDGCPDPSKKLYATDIRINELLPNPSGDENTGEFIELYNTADTAIDLSSWTVKDASASGKYVFPADTKIQPKDFLVIYRETFKFALNNSDETLSLLDPNNEEKDKVSYATTKEDISLNYTATGWRGGKPTPGAASVLNNLPETKEKVPKKGYRGVAVDFDARGKDSDHDTLKYTWDFGDDHKSYKEKTSHTYEENGTYTVILKTTDEKEDTLETFTLKIGSYPHPEVRITSLLPNPAGNDTDNEWIVIENREKKTVNLKGFGIATGWKVLSNHPIREDFFIEPKSEAKLTRQFSLFTLPNQKGKIELRAPDGKVLQKIKYKLEKSIGENIVYRKKKGQKWAFEENIIKNIFSSDTPEETAATDEIVPPENSNEETPPPTLAENVQEEKEPEIIPPPVSLDPDRPKAQELLAYGTRVQLQDAITLTPSPTDAENLIGQRETEGNSLSFPEKLAININASLNGLFNSSQER